ncbi:MAG: Flp pilus assembly protein CpaB [Methylomonas sp.]
MSSQILKIIAAMMLVGSFVLIVIAYRLSNPPGATETTASVKPQEKTYQIATATRAIQAGEIVRDSDAVLSDVTERPDDAIDSLGEVVGKRTAAAIAPGKPILQSHLPTGNPIAHSLKANERAIAIKVSEVIGVGGFIQPGDAVDVIAFLHKDNEQVEENQAVILLQAVRVLSYGAEVPAASTAKPPSKDETVKSKTGTNTAVIAVDAEETALVALVENLGVLRLALRPTVATDSAKSSSPTTLSDVAAPSAMQPAVPEKPKGPMVEIYHGTHVEQVQYP